MQIKNLLFQPLTFSASQDNQGTHLCARELKDIAEEEITNEIRLAADRGFVSLADNQEQIEMSVEIPIEIPTTDVPVDGEIAVSESEPAVMFAALGVAGESDSEPIIKKGTRK